MCGLNLSYNCFSIPIVVINICQVVLQAIELFFTFHSKLLFLGFWIYILSIHTPNIEKYCTFCDSYIQNNTYAVTYCAVDYRVLVHILTNRWSSIDFLNIDWNYTVWNRYITTHFVYSFILISDTILTINDYWQYMH